MDSTSMQGNESPDGAHTTLHVQLQVARWMLMEQPLESTLGEVFPLLGEAWHMNALELLLASPQKDGTTRWSSAHRWECSGYLGRGSSPRLEDRLYDQLHQDQPWVEHDAGFGAWPLPTGRPVRAWLGWEGTPVAEVSPEWLILLGTACLRHLSELEHQLIAEERAQIHRTTNLLLARAGHELRTPLIALKGISTLLEERWHRMPDNRRQEALTHIRRSGERMETLVENILSLARLESGERAFRPEQVDPRSLPHRYLYLVSGLLADKAVEFRSSIGQGVPEHIVTDLSALDEILENLLGNSVKYTEEGSIELCICAESSEQEQTLVIEVRDTGSGIPGELNQRMAALVAGGFQESTPGLNGEKGTGLGLSIVWGLSELLGATFRLEHNQPQGTVAQLSIPVVKPG